MVETIFVKAPKTGVHSYLTPEKVYECELEDDEENSGYIITDAGDIGYILLVGCAYLDDGDWEIVPEKEDI